MAGFVLSTTLDKEYACCNGAIVVAAASSKIIVDNVVVIAISAILVSLLFCMVYERKIAFE